MVNYVNTVLVSNLGSSELFEPAAGNNYKPSTSDAGKFIIMNCDPNLNSNGQKLYDVSASNAGSIQTIKVGYITDKSMVLRKPDGTTANEPIIKWSNEIKAADIKSFSFLSYTADTEDTATIDFTNLDAAVLSKFAEGGKRIIVRITYKDMPHRYRKWTESYEYVTAAGDTKATIAQNIGNMINADWKRARVSANIATTNKVILTALPYDDDDSVDSLSWANKVRFNVNVYYTDPAAEGWEANNKNFPKGVTIAKTPGKQYPASAKLVRDRESWAMGYQGILNRGEGTWPIIKPDMETNLDNHYDAITLEFENMYRAADDIQRKTKQTLEIYGTTGQIANLKNILGAFVAGGVGDDSASISGKQDSLTTAQLAAANSGITAEKVAAYDALVAANG